MNDISWASTSPGADDGQHRGRPPGDGADGDHDHRHRGGDDDVEHRPDLDVAPIGDEQGPREAGDECRDREHRDRQQ